MGCIQVIVGLDIGTTSVKALAVDGSGATLARAVRRIRTRSEEPNQAEQDPQEIYRAVQDVLQEVGAAVVALGNVVSHVGISSAMHSVFVVDHAGDPITPMYTWMDLRAKDFSRDLLASKTGPRRYSRTGTPIHAMAPAIKLQWLRATNPHFFTEGHRFISFKEWLWWKWFDEFVVDESMASATGMFNLTTRQWDQETMDELLISPSFLSRIASTKYTRTGMNTAELDKYGYTSETAVTIGASDGVLANLALGVTHPGKMVLTMGTSLAVRTGSQKIISDLVSRPFCYILDELTYIVGGPSNSGGLVLEWLTRQIGEKNAQAVDERLIEAQHVVLDDLYFLPYVSGERAPIWDENATAAFVGLTAFTHPPQLFRAAIEGILYNARWIAEQLIGVTGDTPTTLILSGRPFAHPWIQQLAADIFGLPVYIANADDASTKGAIVIARMAAQQGDLLTDFEKKGSDPDDDCLFPDRPEMLRHNGRFQRFQMLVKELVLRP